MPITLNGTSGVTYPDNVLQPNGVPAPGTNGNVLTSNGTAWTSSTPPAPAALSTASGSAPSYSARAWVNFNGTGTVAIRASGNVSSITDNSTGDYTVNFATALPDANYAPVGMAVGFGTTDYGTEKVCLVGQATGSYNTTTPILMSTTQCRIGFGNATKQDNTTICVAFFR
jgi:hypothetical protein